MNASEEFQYLKSSLNDLGLFEDGMDIEEMRSLKNAVNESIEESSQIFEDELQTALKESEQMANDSLQRSLESSSYSSMSSDNSNTVYTAKSSTPPSSPDHPLTMCVIADVHMAGNDSLLESNQANSENDNLKVHGKKILKANNHKGTVRKPEDVYSILEVNDDNL